MNSKPILKILIGLPGSGKTFWAEKNLRTAFPTPVVIGTDKLIEAWAIANSIPLAHAYGKLNFKQLKKTMMQEYADALTANRDIIVDQTNMSVKSRRGKLLLAPSHYHKVAIVFSLPPHMLKERLTTRARLTGKFIPENTIDLMAHKYDAPTRDEFDEIVWVTS